MYLKSKLQILTTSSTINLRFSKFLDLKSDLKIFYPYTYIESAINYFSFRILFSHAIKNYLI